MDKFFLLFIGIIFYIIILWIIKKIEYGKKIKSNKSNNCCPSCNAPLNRIRRLYRDHIILHLTFKIFNLKRYRCSECGWRGLRWEDKYKREY